MARTGSWLPQVIAFQFSSPTQAGAGASVTPLLVGQLYGETFESPTLTHGAQDSGRGKGRKRPPSSLAQPKQSQGFGTQLRSGPWRTFECLRQCAETAALRLRCCMSICLGLPDLC